MVHYRGLAILFAMGLFAVTVVANDQAKSPATALESGVQTVPPTAPATLVVTPAENDRRLARWLLADNDVLIASCKLAMERATDPKIKELARTIHDAHQTIHDNLGLVIRAPIEPIGGPIRDDLKQSNEEKKTAQIKPQNAIPEAAKTGNSVVKATLHPTDFVAVKEKVCQTLKSDLVGEFQKLNGAEFDKAFMVKLVVWHEAIVASLSAVKNHPTEQLRNTLEDLRATTDKHLKEIRQFEASKS